MGFFPTLREIRTTSGGPGDDYWYNTLGATTKAGIDVNEEAAMKFLTVASCVMLIAADVAKLPLILFRKNKDGSRTRETGHYLYELMHNRPNTDMNAFNYRETKTGHVCLWGNSYDVIVRDGNNAVRELLPISNPANVTIKREKGELVYKYDNKTYPKKKIFHLAGFGFNGLSGRSMISIARETIGNGLAQEEYEGRFYSNGTHPSGLLKLERPVGGDDKTKEAFKKQWKAAFSGLGKAHNTVVLEPGMDYTPVSMSMADAQFIEQKNINNLMICGFYHVPPHKVAIHGANSNYNSLEAESKHYIDSCLSHYTTRWEAAINEQLLTKTEKKQGLYFEHVYTALLKGDAQARGDFYKTLWNMGVPTNTILALENMNGVPGGENGFVQLNMVPISQAGSMHSEPDNSDRSNNINNNRMAIDRELRSVAVRDNISKQYLPLIEKSARSIVDYEANAVKEKIETLNKRSADDIEQWLNNFYAELPAMVKDELGPVFRTFAKDITDASIEELGLDDEIDTDVFISDFIDRYAERHADSSVGQLVSLLSGELEDLEVRVDEWQDTRPDRIAQNESVRLSNAIYQQVAFAAGLATYWRIRGAKTCDYCKNLNGKKVRNGESFVQTGDVLKAGSESMTIRGIKAHPPLHRGCDCYLAAI